MAMQACRFKYDGISSADYGLYLSSFSSKSADEGRINNGFKVQSTSVARRIKPIHYGLARGDPMEFAFTFGSPEYIPRTAAVSTNVRDIAGWMLGSHEFKRLEFEQDDMNGIHYNAIITSLDQVQLGGCTVGFAANVVCDSPYAWYDSEITTMGISGSQTFNLNNRTNAKEYIYPTLKIALSAASDFRWSNNTTGEMFSLEFSGLNTTALDITFDGSTHILTYDRAATSVSLNLYQCMRLYGAEHLIFPRLAPGVNSITITVSSKKSFVRTGGVSMRKH